LFDISRNEIQDQDKRQPMIAAFFMQDWRFIKFSQSVTPAKGCPAKTIALSLLTQHDEFLKFVP